MSCLWFGVVVTLVCARAIHAQPANSDLRADAVRALKRAATYYHDKVASHGGYVYYYSEDLAERWGEGKASPDTLFVQPPGTPTVGMAYLKAYAATKDSFYLDAAREAADALVKGQLQSGGWTQVIHFAPPERGRVGWYRVGPRRGSWNISSLDDGQTQAALQMLMHTDRALNFQHAAIHEAVAYGLDALLNAQFPNGAFPQVWIGPVEPKPVARAKFPDYDWRTEGRVKNYWDYYTLNDNLAGTVSDTLIEAHQVYEDEKYRVALEKLGDFLILAQMPDPQPGWCQQYSYEMLPIWARKFEPAAISGWESQDVMETLIKIARYTGQREYLEPIPRALAYYQKCLLPDGRIARFYEFETNRPLYMDARYQLTYDDSAVPQHYGWKQPVRFDAIDQAYQKAVRDIGRGAARRVHVPRSDAPPSSASEQADAVRRIIGELDNAGRWITTYAGERLVGQPKFADGFRFISSAVFSHNVETLSDFIAATSRPDTTPPESQSGSSPESRSDSSTKSPSSGTQPEPRSKLPSQSPPIATADRHRRQPQEFHVRAQQRTGLLVPLYLYPANIHTNAVYNRLMDLKRRYETVPFWVIVNPASGPGTERDANYTKAIDRLQGAGCVVLGYVTTRYGKRAAAEVRADIDRWGKLYPYIHGIFFDEMIYEDTAAGADHQSQLNRYAHDAGYWPTVANPGADTPGRYFASDAADVIVVHEANEWPTEAKLKGDYFGGYSDYPPFTRAVLVHSLARFDPQHLQQVRRYARWVYVTDDPYRPTDPKADNPWDSLSKYVEEMCEQLARP